MLSSGQFAPISPAEEKWITNTGAPSAGGLTERAKAMGMGFAGTVAPVVGPWILTHTITTPEEALNWEDKHPIATAMGEGLGILGTLGVGAVAKGVGVAAKAIQAGTEVSQAARAAGVAADLASAARWSAPGMLERAGAAAERALFGQAAQGVETTALGRLTAAAVNQGVQGAGYGLMLGANRAVLGDPDMTAEAVLREGGAGLLFGAGLGAGGSAVWSGIKGLAGGVTASAERLAPMLLRGDPAAIEFTLKNRSAIDKLVKEMPVAGRLFESDLPINQLQTMFSNEPAMREIVGLQAADKVFRFTPEAFDYTFKNWKRIRDLEGRVPHLIDFLGNATDGQMAHLIVDGWERMIHNPQVAQDIALGMRDPIQTLVRHLEEIGSPFETHWRGLAKQHLSGVYTGAGKTPGGYMPVATLQEAQAEGARLVKAMRGTVEEMNTDLTKFVKGARQKLEEVTEDFAQTLERVKTPYDVWQAIESFKPRLGFKFAEGVEDVMTAGAPKATQDILRKLSVEFNSAEKSVAKWGRVAKMLKEIDAVRTADIDAQNELRRVLGLSKVAKLDAGGVHLFELDVDKLIHGLETSIKGKGVSFNEAIDEWLKTTRAKIGVMRKYEFEGMEVAEQQLNAVERGFAETRARVNITQVVKDLQQNPDLQALRPAAQRRDQLMQLAGYVGPRGITGRLTQVVEMLRSPYVASRVLHTLETIGQRTEAVLDGAVGRIFGAAVTGVAVSFHEPITRENYHQFMSRTGSLSNAENAAQRMEERLGPMGSMGIPSYYYVHNKLIERAKHIQSTASKPVRVGVLDRPHVPSRTELHQMNQVLEIHNSPTAVAEKIAQGRLTDKQKQAAQVAWPSHTAELRTKLLSRVLGKPEEFKKLPRAVRANIAQFLEVDLEWAHSGHAVAGTQRLFQSLQAPQQAGQVGSQKARNVELKSQKLYATSTDSALRHLEGRG